jgi:hypothetical protein
VRRASQRPRRAAVRILGALVLAPLLSHCGGDGGPGDPADECAGAQTSLPAPFETRSGILVFTRTDYEVASWNHEEDGVAAGEIIASVGQVSDFFEVRFPDHDLPRELITNRPGTVAETSPCFSLGWSVADEGVGVIEAVEGQPWRFTVRGVSAGRTTVTFDVRRRDGSVVVAAGPVALVVDDPAQPPVKSMDFAIVLNGIRVVFAQGGVLVPSCGATNADPGYLDVKVGEITQGHYSFRELVNPCTTHTLDETIYHLAYEFKDAGLCAIVDHPEHYGTHVIWHMEGLAAGQTEMRVRLFEGDQLVYTSMWIPVVVTP